MNEIDKLQSPLNRAIHSRIAALNEFWQDVPANYMELAERRNSAEAAAYLAQVGEAANDAAKLVNVLAAIVRDLDGPSVGPRIAISADGVPSVDAEAGEWSLLDEVQQHIQEERSNWRRIDK